MDYQEDALRLLGRHISALRQQQQMTIETLAARAQLDPADLAAIEAGKVDIPITTIFLLASAFGIPPDQFLNFLP